MASFLRLVVPVGLFCLLLFGPFLQVASRARVFRKIRLLQGSFVTNETIEGISVFVTCILLCNKHGQCNGIATQDPTQCTLLRASDEQSTSLAGPLDALWDSNHPYFNSSREEQTYTSESPLNLGVIKSWRECHNQCFRTGLRMMKATLEYDDARELFEMFNKKFYLDGIRAVGDNNFYDSDGNLVLDGNNVLNTDINEPNTRLTGLFSKWGMIGDVHSELEFTYYDILCLCISQSD